MLKSRWNNYDEQHLFVGKSADPPHNQLLFNILTPVKSHALLCFYGTLTHQHFEDFAKNKALDFEEIAKNIVKNFEETGICSIFASIEYTIWKNNSSCGT